MPVPEPAITYMTDQATADAATGTRRVKLTGVVLGNQGHNPANPHQVQAATPAITALTPTLARYPIHKDGGVHGSPNLRSIVVVIPSEAPEHSQLGLVGEYTEHEVPAMVGTEVLVVVAHTPLRYDDTLGRIRRVDEFHLAYS